MAAKAGVAALLLLILWTAWLPVRVEAQAWLAATVVAMLLLLKAVLPRLPQTTGRVLRIGFLALGAFASLRYLIWRATYTISTHDPLSHAFSLLLLFAEAYAIAMYLAGMLVNIHPLRRAAVEPLGTPEQWPTVDVLIPTYDEPVDVLRNTLVAATQLDYPAGRYRVWLCDDGGTAQKLAQPDAALAAQSAERARRLKALCSEVGASYLTRERNEHAKAGNINAALPRTSSELILMLDCDHVPTADILRHTVGYFQRDPKLFLVQTPHFFVTPDPVERNLKVFGRMPGENEMFYDRIQLGLDFWGASFFCGSAAVIRREALIQNGGLSRLTVTEDAETSLGLHARGWHSVYVNRPMVAGLHPPSFTDFVLQRMRWAQGMAQMFLLTNPLKLRGLTAWQRVGYLTSSMFWFFGFVRIAFLVAPLAFLLFGLYIFDANGAEFAAYALPHLVGGVLVEHVLFGNVRWTLFSQLYEVLLAPFSVRALLAVVRNPHSPRFRVTPKTGRWDSDFISHLVAPFYVLFGLSVLAFGVGLLRLFVDDVGHRDTLTITLFWQLVNLVILTGALGALLERRQRRKEPRMPAWRRAWVRCDGTELPGHVFDLSLGGAAFSGRQGDAAIARGSRAELCIADPQSDRVETFDVTIVHVGRRGGHRLELGLRFAVDDLATQRRLVASVMGSSERWEAVRRRRSRPFGIWRPLVLLIRLGLRHALEHFGRLVLERRHRQRGATLPATDLARQKRT